MKSVLRFGPVTAALGWVIWAYTALCACTIRWRVEGDEEARRAWGAPGGIVVASWHAAIPLLPAGWIRHMRHWPGRRAACAMLISRSPDGEPVARAIRRLGLSAIRGSTANKQKRKPKGGAAAIASASRLLRAGGAVCVTPDGPRGPARRAGLGPILLAQRAGAEILPYAIVSTPHKTLKTWDKMQIPIPFSRGAIVFGAPLSAPRATPPEALRHALETALNRATERAEALSTTRAAAARLA